jgi:DNA-binding CsgD family transcriptional regulator
MAGDLSKGISTRKVAAIHKVSLNTVLKVRGDVRASGFH